jgi:hypothetical protein
MAVTGVCQVVVEKTRVGDDAQNTLAGLLPGKLTLCTALLLNEMQDEVPPLHLVLKSDAVHKLPIFVLPATWIVTIGPLHEPAEPPLPVFPVSTQFTPDRESTVGAEA